MTRGVADVMVDVLVQAGAKRCYGVPADMLNYFTDAARRPDLRWIHVRHEEAGAMAAGAFKNAMESANSHGVTPGGTLRINSSLTAAHQFLSPIVLDYLRGYPEVKVDLVTEARLVDIVLDGFDAGIRLIESVPRDIIAIPLESALSFSVAGSPAYFANRHIPSTPGDLMSHRCIRARWPSGGPFDGKSSGREKSSAWVFRGV
jgi:DNA-binding transcriptional LysR family regulator